jgi:hypothetical protein
VSADERALQVKATRAQALFREVNERVNVLQTTRSLTSPIDFICECADDACSKAIPVEREVYERVRSSPTHFVVAPEHFVEAAEDLVERAQRYWIVDVIGAGRPVAEATYPRRATG